MTEGQRPADPGAAPLGPGPRDREPSPGAAGGRTACPVVAVFEAVVDRDPQRPAIVRRDRAVTFGELDARANAVAHQVLGLPGGAGDPVALRIADPVAMVAAQLGTLKAGRPYAVINPHFPAARAAAMRRLLRATTVLCDGEAASDGELAVAGGAVTVRPRCPAGPTDLAYVLFTSGSTGTPKGIAQTREDMLHNVGRHAPLGLSAADRITLISADGIVSAVSNLVIGLCNGAAVVPYSYRSDGVDGMLEWMADTGVTVFYGFPSFLRQLATVTPVGAAVPAVRLAYLGGEPVLPTDFAALGRLFPRAVRASGLNSTETGLTRLYQLLPGAPVPDRVPLGGPVDGVDVVLTGEGRIAVRSRYVRPRLWTADGLVELATPDEHGIAEFVTGDRGELDAAGNLVHLGRSDAMVKVRGFRIEPSEVEAAIAKVDGVTEVAVVPYDAGDGQLELAAVVTVGDPAVEPTGIRRRAGELLPQPMVPATVVIRDSLPRTSNGKLDRRALVPIVAAAAAGPRAGAPADTGTGTGTYERLRAIWQLVLRTERIAPDDDFFALGGTSISALGVISRVRKEFGVPVRLAVLFETPTLAALARAVDELTPGAP